MSKLNSINFNGQNYFDDRLFVLYLCKGKVEIGSDVVTTTIYHNNGPEFSVWCVVTYRNCDRYPAYRVDSFNKKDDAIEYIKKVEPETPLISLNGAIPSSPV